MQDRQGSENPSPEQAGGWQPPASGAGAPSSGGPAPGVQAPGQHIPGQQVPGEPVHSQPGYGQAAPGEPVPGEPVPRTPVPGVPMPGGPAASAPEQGTWILPTGDQGSWAAPPARQSPWGRPRAGEYGQPGGYGEPAEYGGPGGYGQPGGFEPPRGQSRAGRALVYILVAVLAAALGAGGVLALQRGAHQNQSASPQNIPGPGSAPGGNTNTSTINKRFVASKVRPGVVDITSYLRYTGQVFEGTGIVLSSNGLVLTNNHVVNGSTRLLARLVTSGRTYRAQIVGTDAKDDVALIRLVGASGLKTVKVGDSSKVTLGMPVVAIGNAGGAGGTPAITQGAITGLSRTITASDAGSATSETLHGMLQTNAPIAEGDSGGPLANAAGQVIGMDTAANTQNLGGFGAYQGFAIPINRALKIARQMASGHGSPTIRIGQPAFLGIAIASTQHNGASTAASPQQQLRQLEQVASGFGGGINSSRQCLTGNIGNPVPRGGIAPVRSGTLIAGVFCGAPAQQAGLTGGDVIVAVNSQPVTSPVSLTTVMSHFRPGNTVSVSWVDTHGHHHVSQLRLAAGPAK